MCGRFSCFSLDAQSLSARFDITKISFDIKPRFNIAPQQPVPTVINTSPKELTLTRWGLVPHWAKDQAIGYKMINARAESIADKPSFRKPIRTQRCLILADSFYEWKKTDQGKQPYQVMLKNEEIFALAGIWDIWEKKGNALLTSAIITTEANTLMQPIHERMPVILPKGSEQLWLLEKDLDKVLSLLKPFEPGDLKAYPISASINSPVNDQPAQRL